MIDRERSKNMNKINVKRWSALILSALLICTPLIKWLPDVIEVSAESSDYRSPFDVAYSPDGTLLAVADETKGLVYFVDTTSGNILRSAAVNGKPRGLQWIDNTILYVAEYGNGTIAEIASATGQINRRIITGSKPVDLVKIPNANKLAVTDYGRNQVAIVNLDTGQLEQQVDVKQYPFNLDVSPDGQYAVVGHLLPSGDATSAGYGSSISFVSLSGGQVAANFNLPQGTSAIREIACSPNGQWAYVVHTLGKTSIPTTHITKGWVNTNALTILDMSNQNIYATVLLDRIMEGAADPWGVEVSADNNTIWVSVAGTHQVMAIELDRLHSLLAGNVPALDNASYYALVNRSSGRYIDVPGKSTNNDVQMIQWDNNGGDNQRWKLREAGNGYKYIISKHSNKALDVKGATASGSAVVQYTYTEGNQSQQWKVESVGDGYVKIVNRASNLIMDNNGSNNNGAQIVQNAYTGTGYQQWELKLMEDASTFRSKSGFDHPYSDIWFEIKADPSKRAILKNDLGALWSAGLMKVIELDGQGPRGMALSPDGNKLAVGAYYQGKVYIINTSTKKVESTIDLGSQPAEDPVRRGERKFHDASTTTQKWLSCATCHAEGRSDGLNWDLLNDGMGNPKNSKSMLATFDTPPVMAHGVRDNASIAVAAGFKHIKFMKPTQDDLDDVSAYLQSLTPEVDPYRQSDGSMTADAVAGKAIFESSQANCASCHSGAYYTDLNKYDVGTMNELDSSNLFDTPTLLELWRSAPYLHDGSAATIKDVLTTKNSGDKHGGTSHLTETELQQLEAYILQLGLVVTPDTEAPTKPTNLSMANKSDTTVKIGWTASTDNVGVTGYDVFQDGNQVGTVTDLSYEATGLTANTTYSYTIKAKDAAGNLSELSDAISVTTDAEPDTEAPSVPTALTLNNKTETTVSFSWTASTDNVGVIGYDVYQDGNQVGTTASTSYEATGLTAGTAYQFAVKAKDSAGNISDASSTLAVTTDQGQVLVNVAEGKTASADSVESGRPPSMGNDGNIATRWCAANGNTGHWWKVDLGGSYNLTGSEIMWEFNNKVYDYKLEVSDDDNNWSMLLDKTENTSSNQIQEESFTGSGRYVRLTVTDLQVGCWASFFELKIYGTAIADTEAPSAPTNLVSTAITETSVSLSWESSTDNVGVTGYIIYEGGTEVATVTETSYDATGLTANTAYTYTVKAKDNAGNLSSTSNTLQVTTDTPQPVIVYLTDITWHQVANGWGNAEANRSNGEKGDSDGNTITLNGTTYEKGIGAHAASEITVDLTGDTYSKFQSDIGIDDEVGTKGSIVFQVWLDGAKTYESATLTGATDPVSVDVDVTGKSTLKLVITDAGDGNAYDHGDWAGARLIK